MKFIFCVLFLNFGDSLASGDYWLRNEHNYDGHLERHHRSASQNYNGHNESNIERPCPKNEEHCVRIFFAKNSKCKPTFGPAPDPYIIDYLYMDVPHSNMTIETYNAKHIGINSGKIKQFFINKKTDTLVLEVEFKNVVVDSPKTMMSYYAKGKTPIVATDITVVEIKCLSLTFTVQQINEINPEKGHVFTHLSEMPIVKVGPRLINVTGLSRTDMVWMDDVSLTGREVLATQAPLYLAVFLQSKICNFRKDN